MSNIKEQLDQIANRLQNKTNYPLQRFLIFLFIGTERDSQKAVTAFQKESEIFVPQETMIRSIAFWKDSPDSLVNLVKKVIDQIAQQRYGLNVSNISVYPVFLYDSQQADDERTKLLDDVDNHIKTLIKFFLSENTNTLWWPSVIPTEKTENAKLILFVSELQKRYEKLNEQNTTPTSSYLNNIMILRRKDTNNMTVRSTTIYHTLLLQAILFSDPINSSIRNYKNGSVYSARAFQLSIPIHLQILKRAISLLRWFRMPPDNPNEKLKKLGERMYETSRQIWWRRWYELPFTDTSCRTISTEPIRSLYFPQGMDTAKIRSELQNFSNKFYFSKTPLENQELLSEENMRYFQQCFWNAYSDCFDNYIYSISNIGSLVEQIPNFHVETGTSLSENGHAHELHGEVAEAERTLSQRMSTRMRDLYRIVFGSGSCFAEKIVNRNREVSNLLQAVEDQLNTELRWWQGEECVSDDYSEPKWNPEDRETLMRAWLKLIESDDNEDESFVNEMFRIVQRPYFVRDPEEMARNYFVRMIDNYLEGDRDSQRTLWVSFSENREQLLAPNMHNISDNSTWYFIVDAGNERAVQMCNGFVETIKNNKNEQAFIIRVVAGALPERIEVIRISQLIDWGDTDVEKSDDLPSTSA